MHSFTRGFFFFPLSRMKEALWCWGPALAGSRGYPQDERRRREKTPDSSLDRAKSVRERERQRERERETRWGVQQSLANLYFFYRSFYILS